MQDGCPVISIHPPLAGRDYRTTDNRGIKRHFNPPAPCGAGLGPWLQASERAYFNPPAPCGAGRALCVPTFCGKHFNPPAPCGAGLVLSKVNVTKYLFQSTRPLRGGTTNTMQRYNVA